MNNAIIAAPIIAGILVGVFLVYLNDELNSEPESLTISNLKAGGSPVKGDASATVTILEYGDYQCTFCYRFHQSTLKTIETAYIDTGKVNLVFKDFALNGPDSILAAQASHCAADQNQYWQYHDTLYDNWAGEKTGWITRDVLVEFAASLQLDTDAFSSCLDGGKYQQMVLDTYNAAQGIGIDATPSFLVFNDNQVIKIRGNQPLQVFTKTIDELLN